MASRLAERPRLFRGLVLLTLGWTFALVVIGAVVRVTGSGLGCPDWPLCHGRLIPPLEATALIEYSHRLAASLATALVALTAIVAWLRRREGGHVLALAALAAGLLVAQILLGGVTVLLELPPIVVTAHLALAEALLGTLTLLAVLAFAGRAALSPPRALYVVAAAAVFLLLLTGAYLRGSGASLACTDWPICLPLLPSVGPLAIHLAHRYVAALVGALVGWAVIVAWRDGHRRLATATGALFVAQVVVGAFYLFSAGSALAQGAHLAVASAVWCVLVALAGASAVQPADEEEGARQREGRRASLRATAADYAALTKPPIIALLLVTALGGMFLAAQGAPPAGLVLVVLVGGALGAGGANALNHYLDRDIDELMARTRRRPLPGGRVAPRDALAFGLVLNVASFAVLALFANLLAAALTLGASAFYVLVYTIWLKRASDQNIVIGGAAGAVPPLVGWAAVTGDLSLPAYYLFAIVFFWTPAHFWALALLIREDYERAGIPMLPVVRGERAAAWGVLLYAIATVALTVLLFTTQAVGLLYVVLAVALGLVFVGYALQYLRDAQRATARRVYLYSMLYLALLFVAMIVDSTLRS